MASDDVVFIEGLSVETVIGVFDWESAIKQTLVLDLEMKCDIEPAASSDALEHALNYAAVADAVLAYGEMHRFKLIEAFAEGLLEQLLTEFPVTSIRLKLKKPYAVKQAQGVGLIIERAKRS